MHESGIASGLCAGTAHTAKDDDHPALPLRWKLLIPPTDSDTWTASTRSLAAESTGIPLGMVMVHQRKLCGKYPPVTLERQIAAGHVRKRDILPSLDFGHMLVEALPQCSAALCRAAGCFPYIDQALSEVKHVDSTFHWSDVFLEGDRWACFQALDKLALDSPILSQTGSGKDHLPLPHLII